MINAGRIEFEQGYVPSARELFLEGMLKHKEKALDKLEENIEKLNWELDIYRKFVFNAINSGQIDGNDFLLEADRVLKSPTIKATYPEWERG